MIQEGSEVRLTCEFRDPFDGYSPVDPETVKVAWLTPGGSYTEKTYGTDPEVVRDGTGQYHLDILANAGGTWKYRWWGTGTVTAAAEGKFEVAAREVVQA